MAGPGSPSGAEGPTFAPPHPPTGWIAQWDGSSRKYYFVQLSTGVSQWELPTEAAANGTPAPDASNPYGLPPRPEIITHPDGTQTLRHANGHMEPIMPPQAPADGTRGGAGGPDGDRGLTSMAINGLLGQQNGKQPSLMGNMAQQFIGGKLTPNKHGSGHSSNSPLENIAQSFLGGGGGGKPSSSSGHADSNLLGAFAQNLMGGGGKPSSSHGSGHADSNPLGAFAQNLMGGGGHASSNTHASGHGADGLAGKLVGGLTQSLLHTGDNGSKPAENPTNYHGGPQQQAAPHSSGLGGMLGGAMANAFGGSSSKPSNDFGYSNSGPNQGNWNSSGGYEGEAPTYQPYASHNGSSQPPMSSAPMSSVPMNSAPATSYVAASQAQYPPPQFNNLGQGNLGQGYNPYVHHQQQDQPQQPALQPHLQQNQQPPLQPHLQQHQQPPPMMHGQFSGGQPYGSNPQY